MRELTDAEMSELLGYVCENPDLIKIIKIECMLRTKAQANEES